MRVDSDGILVSVGHKSEGIVPQREMRSVTPDTAARYQVGESIQVYVMDASGSEGQALLSIDRARGEASWSVLEALAENGGTIENAQAIAAHESPRTTKLYDHTSDEITLDEVERIAI